jgi:hypothetical protein
MWSAIYLYYLMSRNEEIDPFSGSGPDEIAPSIQAKLSSYQVRWLNKQCDKLKSKKGNLGSLVRVNMSVYKAPPELKARIQASLQKESRSQLEWFSHFLVLSLFPAWARIAISHGRDQGLIAEAVSDHSRSLLVNHLLDITSSDQRVVKPWFTGKLDYSPPVVDLTQAGYKLVGCGKSPD